MIKKRPLLFIEWDDITTHRSYRDEDETKETVPVICHSVGWQLPNKNRRYITITPMRFDTGECGDRQTIPRGCIRSIKVLMVRPNS